MLGKVSHRRGSAWRDFGFVVLTLVQVMYDGTVQIYAFVKGVGRFEVFWLQYVLRLLLSH